MSLCSLPGAKQGPMETTGPRACLSGVHLRQSRAQQSRAEGYSIMAASSPLRDASRVARGGRTVQPQADQMT